jgi:mRNA-degrading endonuclease RelE of RelBE toxin-antitoxin system
VIYSVRIDTEAHEFYQSLDAKSRRILRAHLELLTTDPLPGKTGDKELLNLRDDVKIYRMHISHSFTLYYEIKGHTVYVNEILTIEQAHKKYRRL